MLEMVDVTNFATPADEIFQILRSYDYTIMLYGEDGNRVEDPTEARRMFARPENIMISLIDEGDDSSVKLYIGKDTNISDILGLIQHLRTVSSKFNLLFNVAQYGKKITPKDFAGEATSESTQRLKDSHAINEQTDVIVDRIFYNLKKNLNEAVVLNGLPHTAAYAIVVAEAYDALPRFDQSVAPLWQAFAQQNDNVMLQKIASTGIRVYHTPNDPFDGITDDAKMMVRYLLWDMVVKKELPIYSGHSDDHPVFSPDQNVIFRTVHDYFAHGKLRSNFKRELEKRGLLNTQPTPEELAKILPTIQLNQSGNIGHSFSLRGEINAYLTHSKLVSSKLVPVLFTEVVGQASYQNVVGDFPTQKVAIIHGFDYQNVGKVASSSIEHRMNEIIDAIKNKTQFIDSKISAKPKIDLSELVAHLKHYAR